MANRTSAPDHRDAITLFARMGYAARGVVYLLIGGLAALAAFGEGGQTEGSRGALERVLTAPFGKIILAVIALGLLGYAMWRTIQALKDADHHGNDAKGLAIRAGLMVSAVTHTLLAFYAASLIFRLGGSSGESNGSQGTVSWLLQQPFGRWIVGAVGLAIIGAGIAHGLKGLKAKFDKNFDMPEHTKRWAYPVCRFGLSIRGLVFVIVGSFFLIAAYQISPSEAGGTEEVFSALRSQAYGQWLLAFVAVGLFAFGAYSVLAAIYRRINPAM
ncbi:uncharacterized protein DUF1206 [Vreelandella songnenensis]|uniref:Uncharacterized protein DUF1206 n=1 Tax=Vreelandella songnenensis TaxID=1176243 RepID=A0A2T0V1G6_9GAMM|nr:DUF1206 domain-containing protein [Halomonas songnenensis]PRY64011.1 uncharacterized protein DUF1206 [Halomonas songnenensis]